MKNQFIGTLDSFNYVHYEYFSARYAPDVILSALFLKQMLSSSKTFLSRQHVRNSLFFLLVTLPWPSPAVQPSVIPIDHCFRAGFYWDVSTEALSSRVWKRIIAVDDIDMANYGTMEMKRKRHCAALAKRLLTFGCGTLIDDDVDVDLWCYWIYSERLYVAFLC